MRYRNLGTSGLNISLLTLGTMTYGEQTPEEDAHRQLDMAVEAGINIIDTAEMYPVPPRGETYTRTESIIGRWLSANPSKRQKLVVATKAAGPGARLSYIRPQIHPHGPRFDRASLTAAVEASLQRLKLETIDYYQLHWPDRNTNYFDQLGFSANPDEQMTPIEETLEALSDLVKQGKIRHIGVSNETPWGVTQFLAKAKAHHWPRIQGVQNPYNLLKRDYEVGLAEISWRENVGLLAYSPLAMGVLTGKYRDGAMPQNSRMALFGKNFPRYLSARAQRMSATYAALAESHGLSPALMALGFVAKQPFVSSVIIGATTSQQLAEILPAGDLILNPEISDAITKCHQQEPVGY